MITPRCGNYPHCNKAGFTVASTVALLGLMAIKLSHDHIALAVYTTHTHLYILA